MNNKFQNCLDRGKIKPFSRGEGLVPKELEIAKSDLGVAKENFENGHYKWATVQSYYSIFHSARALLYAKNYRERSHFCLIEAIRALYLEKGLLGYPLLFLKP